VHLADLGALGAMTTRQVALVGDQGQIDPLVTGDVSRWADSPTRPVDSQTASNQRWTGEPDRSGYQPAACDR
jgi:hypothetical protein